MNNQFYLLREREFLKSNEPIYKIGRTDQKFLTRMSGYPKGSEVIFNSLVANCFVLETNIKKIFKQLFIHRIDIGNEYFEGNVNEMLEIIRQQINLQIDNLKNKTIENAVLEDIKIEIKNNIEIKNLDIENDNIEYFTYTEEQDDIMSLYNKAYILLKSILDDKKNLKFITSGSQLDAISYFNNITICDSDDPETIKMIDMINKSKYILYNLMLNNFDDLKILANQ